jgi:RNA polymerase sigma-70 factor (ECF subfamily)
MIAAPSRFSSEVGRGLTVDVDDAQLATAIAQGDPEAEAEFYRRFRDRVDRKVKATLSEGPDCEDLTAEILEGAIETIRSGRFRGECRIATFVHAVARNKIAEFLRRRRTDDLELTEEIPSAEPSPDEVVARGETVRAIRAAVGRLDSKYRIVLYLHYFRGLSIGEIAETLGLPPRRISERKDYALKVIRKRFGAFLIRFR